MISVINNGKIKLIPNRKPSNLAQITYLRISITDRCNLKCFYCRPEEHDLVPREEILSYEDMTKLVKILKKIWTKNS